MDTYGVYKFLHVSAAVIWVGSGFGLFVLTARMKRIGDRAGVLAIGRHAETLGKTLFAPASLATLAFGILMVATTDALSFTDTWIIVGLVGIALSIVIGMGMISPTGKRLGETVIEKGPDAPEIDQLVSRLVTLNAVDLVILFGVIWAMVLKPGG